MPILRTPPDPTRPPGQRWRAATHVNTETHWWDASQIYGSDARLPAAGAVRQRRQAAGRRERLPGRRGRSRSRPSIPADVPGFWLGLAMLHTLFTLEHNAICDRLRAEYPTWSDDELFERARLVNAALLAKIHTVEWTPAIIGHPTTDRAMRANWWGLAGERVQPALRPAQRRARSSAASSGVADATTSACPTR